MTYWLALFLRSSTVASAQFETKYLIYPHRQSIGFREFFLNKEFNNEFHCFREPQAEGPSFTLIERARESFKGFVLLRQ
jgi:hypothetical protein